jgi:hypothetical protein
MKIIMKCPCCKTKLINGDLKKFQTLTEHVCDPNQTNFPLRQTYICEDKNCVSHKYDMFWNDGGECYSDKWYEEDIFIDKNSGPFGTISRKINLEVYKKNLKDKKYLSPAWILWIYQPYIEYVYEGNEEGEVLSTKKKLNFLKRNENGEFSIHVYWNITSFINELKSFNKMRKRYKYSPSSYLMKELKDEFNINAYPNKKNYRRFAIFIKNIFFFKLKKSLYHIDFDFVKMILKTLNNDTFNRKDIMKIFTCDKYNCKRIEDKLLEENFIESVSYGVFKLNLIESRKRKINKIKKYNEQSNRY